MAAPGSHTFFHKPPVNPNLATLLHCTQISAINFPHCAVARLSGSQPSPPSFLRLLLVLVPHPPFRPPAYPLHQPPLSFLCNPPGRSRSRSIPHRHISLLLHSRSQAHGPHCHWQTDLNSGIKSIRSNGTRYIQSNENSALRKKSIVAQREHGI